MHIPYLVVTLVLLGGTYITEVTSLNTVQTLSEDVGGYPTVLHVQGYSTENCMQANGSSIPNWSGYCLVPDTDCSHNILYRDGIYAPDRPGNLYMGCESNPDGLGGVIRLYYSPACTNPIFISAGTTFGNLFDGVCLPLVDSAVPAMNSVIGVITMSGASSVAQASGFVVALLGLCVSYLEVFA